ncbi:glucose-6-phosphate dehydrogenase assembly protein OpcA [Arthrobacter roseus]|nr:glucose-6-phosphate dehydrogenase assembly protein OpcA [Arthrobacter roseus]
MIVDLPNTTTSKVSKKIVSMREQGGVVALGRVMTLVVLTRAGHEEEAIAAANAASREHPCRIIVLIAGDTEAPTKLDAQIRVGGDAGASEVVLLSATGELTAETESLVSALLLPDAPIVAWWPHGAPRISSSHFDRSYCSSAHHRRRQRTRSPKRTVPTPENLYGRRHRPCVDASHQLAHPASRSHGPTRCHRGQCRNG